MGDTEFVLDFAEITLKDLPRVGGKNASLGELFHHLKPHGVVVFDGFATTASAYRHLLNTGGLDAQLRSIFSRFDPENLQELARCGERARAAILETPIPEDVRNAILEHRDGPPSSLSYPR
jgi:pyruvate, water dikinase